MIDYPEDETVYIEVNTFDAESAPVAPSEAFVAADFEIHKNGSATAKATTNGVTVASPFDSTVGCHVIAIDTSNDTGDVGFWEAGATYKVRAVTAKTVDSVSINGAWLPKGAFSIGLLDGRKMDLVNSLNTTAVGQIAAAVWAVATSTLTGEGTIGKLASDTLTNLASMIEDVTGWRFTEKALEQGPSGSTAVTLTPVASTVDAGVVSDGVVTFYLDEGKTITITVVDNAGDAVDMTGKTLTLTVEDDNQVEAFTVSSGSITGADGSVSIVVAAADIDEVGTYCYYLREPSNGNRLWAKGVLHIRYAA